MRRLALLVTGLTVLLMLGCKGPAYPKDDPRLPPDLQQKQSEAAGSEAGSDTPAEGTPTDAPAADAGGSPPADGGG